MIRMLISMALTAYVINASQQSGGSVALAELVRGERTGVIRGSGADVAVRGAGGQPVAFGSLDGALTAINERVVKPSWWTQVEAARPE